MSRATSAPRLIETVRIRNGVAPLWPLHLARLTRSAAELGIILPPLERPAGGDDRIIRFELGNGELRSSEREVGLTAPLALLTASLPHHGYPHKTTARGWLDAARLPAQARSADDVLFFDRDGWLVEATIWAIGWWDREKLLFPPLSLGGLPSVARARLVESVRGGIGEGRLRREEIGGKALVACNAARGVVAVAALDEDAVVANQRTVAIGRRFWEHQDA